MTFDHINSVRFFIYFFIVLEQVQNKEITFHEQRIRLTTELDT